MSKKFNNRDESIFEKSENITLLLVYFTQYKDRIYLWDDLDTAINYVDISHHKNKDDAWVFEVDASGMDLFKDPEEASKSFYVENNIPPSRLKLVYKSK
jgi:hypothetical protein